MSFVADLVESSSFANDEDHLLSVLESLEENKNIIIDLQEEEMALIAQLNQLEEEERVTMSSTGSLQRKESLIAFNEKPKKGIKLFLECGEIEENTPEAIAKFLFESNDLNKGSIGEYLGEPGEFNLKVLSNFAELHSFEDLSFVDSLRLYLSSFRLPGESQKIDRMMEAFANAYHKSCDNHFHNSDTAYVLAFATIMLNTSLHNPNIKDKMTLDGFFNMNRGIDNGKDVDPQFLQGIYESIGEKEFDVHGQQDQILKTFVDPEKSGWMHKEGGSVKTVKRRFFVLKNSCLYYFDNENSTKPKGTIPLENLVVYPTGKPWWFEVRGEREEGSIKSAKMKKGLLVEGKHTTYRINAPSEEDMNDWITKLRAAMTKDPLFNHFHKAQQRAKNTKESEE
eukprot:m.27307 g.27307  ORF g.27307 m.27307 type:complete len:396 (+) comp5929_c0_seq1:73-1260(+)